MHEAHSRLTKFAFAIRCASPYQDAAFQASSPKTFRGRFCGPFFCAEIRKRLSNPLMLHPCGFDVRAQFRSFLDWMADASDARMSKMPNQNTETKAEEVKAAALNTAAIAHLDLPLLVGTDRQMSWASTIRTKRVAAMAAPGGVADHDACLRVSDAKWWIDHRDLPDLDMIAAAARLPRQ